MILIGSLFWWGRFVSGPELKFLFHLILIDFGFNIYQMMPLDFE